MKILMIAINDPAGTAISFTKAINKYTGHSCRLITKEIRYNFMFEKDLHLPWLDENGWDQVEDLLKTSDVFHFHMTADENLELGPFRLKYFLKGKRILHHHHGHPEFRSNPKRFSEKYRKLGRRAVVSTPDLLKLMPEAGWQPNLVPIDDPLYLPLAQDNNATVRVCQAPTRKDLKNTNDFIAVMQRLRHRYSTIEPVIIENRQHRECLRIKQSCHIHFDHMQGYYGISSLESLSQGKPVIAGIDSWNITHIQAFTETDGVPWIVAGNPIELEEKIAALAADSQLRARAGCESRTFMERYWSDRKVCEQLERVYESL